MKSTLIAALIAVALTGCAGSPNMNYHGELAVPTHVFTCKTKVECNGLWVEAQDDAELATGMKIRLLTDDRIETYSNYSYRYRAIISKTVLANSTRIEFRCEGADWQRMNDLCESQIYNKMKYKIDLDAIVSNYK